MEKRFFHLLGKLKKGYSKKLLKEFFDFFENDFYVDVLHPNADNTRDLLNGQDKRFYQELASVFVNNLNDLPLMYFMLWEPIIYFFNADTKYAFYRTCLELSNFSEATDFINGFIEIEENLSPEIAQYHFNRIEHYVGNYFTGLCYLDLRNYENAIKKNEIFISNLEDLIIATAEDEVNLITEVGLLITRWNVYNDLGYLYSRVKDYSKAKKHYEKSLEIFDLEECFRLKSKKHEFQEIDDFTIFVNNYLLSLEKLGYYSTAIQIVEFVIEKKPNDSYYKNLKKSFETKNVGVQFADEVIEKLFKTKKPFNIDKFEKTKLISKEKALEDLIVEQIKYGYHVFGKALEIYQDEKIFGRQYYIASVNGFLDLLLIDKSTDTVYVVELKRNAAGIEVVSQLEKYMQGLSMELNRRVKGIVCLHKPDSFLRDLVKTKPDIELYTYHFDFNRED